MELPANVALLTLEHGMMLGFWTEYRCCSRILIILSQHLSSSEAYISSSPEDHLSLALALSLSLSFSRARSLSLSHSLTHTHTHFAPKR
jgi:hypothetical protein